MQSLAGKQFQTELRLRLADVFAADRLQAEVLDLEIAASLDDLSSETWREAQSGLFGALAMEKFLTGLMLMMIVAVGAVNIVSTLVMAVSEAPLCTIKPPIGRHDMSIKRQVNTSIFCWPRRAICLNLKKREN